MTQENKDLLLKDLCSRLPYDVYVRRYVYTTPDDAIESVELFNVGWLRELYTEEAEFKPYLFPLSVMTKEQEEEWDDLYIKPLCERLNPHTRKEDLMLRAKAGYAATFWLIKNHFDYLGLIPLGLAIDATNLNIY